MTTLVITFVFSNGTAADAVEVNTNNTDITTVINGGLDGANFANGAIPDSDLADQARVSVYFSENIAPDVGFVESGLTFVSSSLLTITLSAGTAYAQRTSTTPNAYLRIRKASSSLISGLSTNSDNYIDLDTAGVFRISPVSIGAGAPPVFVDSVRIILATTDGTGVTSTTDKRPLNALATIGVMEHYIDGLELEFNTTTLVTLRPGNADVGGSILTSIADITLDLTASGSFESGSPAADQRVYLYIKDNGSGGITLRASTDTPNISDTSDNTDGRLRYRKFATVLHRYVGAVRKDSSAIVTFVWDGESSTDPWIRMKQTADTAGYEVASAISPTSFNDVDCSKPQPDTSKKALIQIEPLGNTSAVTVRANGGGDWEYTIGDLSAGVGDGQHVHVETDASQIFEAKHATNTSDWFLIGYWDRR